MVSRRFFFHYGLAPLLLPLLRRQPNQSPPHHPLLPSWPSHFTTNLSPLLPTYPLGPLSTRVWKTSSSKLASSRWCRQANYVVCQVRMRTHISTSSSYVTPSSSRTSHTRASVSACFHSLLRRRQNSGSTRTEKLSARGTNVPRCFLLNSAPWAKPMP
jgi:hypothetical protein